MLSSRLDWIDGAKGIFAIIVVICHIYDSKREIERSEKEAKNIYI